MRACGTTLFVGLVMVTSMSGAACKDGKADAMKPAPITTTQSADVPRKFLNAADCAKPEFKTDERCDWYFDPMRDSQLGEDKKDAPANK